MRKLQINAWQLVTTVDVFKRKISKQSSISNCQSNFFQLHAKPNEEHP